MKLFTSKNGTEININKILAITNVEVDSTKLTKQFYYTIVFETNASLDLFFDTSKQANTCRNFLIKSYNSM